MALLALVFFAALSLNLILNFAVGVREVTQRKQIPALHLAYPWLILFVSTLLLWVFFARIFAFSRGILDFLLILPLSVLASSVLEKLFYRFVVPPPEGMSALFTVGSSYSELTAVSVLLTLHFAVSFADALLLSLSFAVGGFAVFLIIKEIQKRSSIEIIPYGLRGTPILLISMGILSLVFSAVSVLLLKSFL